MIALRALFLLLATISVARADSDPALEVRLVPHFGAPMPATAVWHDEHNRAVPLGSLISGHPTLLVLAYYHCPMLCPRVLQSLASTMKESGLERTGLQVVAASIDPNDTSTVAMGAQQTFLDTSLLPPKTVHFLTGPSEVSLQLATAAGVKYAYDPVHKEYAHPAEFILLDRSGRVARYLPAFTTTLRDLRLAVADVDAGVTTNIWDHALLLCYAYDPVSGRYTFAIMGLLRIAGAVTVGLLLLLYWRLRRRDIP